MFMRKYLTFLENLGAGRNPGEARFKKYTKKTIFSEFLEQMMRMASVLIDAKREIVDFGKYKGKSLYEISEINMGYLTWMKKETDFKNKRLLTNFINLKYMLKDDDYYLYLIDAKNLKIYDDGFTEEKYYNLFRVFEKKDIETLEKISKLDPIKYFNVFFYEGFQINFGKYRNKHLTDVYKTDKGYVYWMNEKFDDDKVLEATTRLIAYKDMLNDEIDEHKTDRNKDIYDRFIDEIKKESDTEKLVENSKYLIEFLNSEKFEKLEKEERYW